VYIGSNSVPSIEQSIMGLQAGKAALSAELLKDPRLLDQIQNATKTKLNIRTLKKIFSV
jgi:hypothetical protein